MLAETTAELVLRSRLIHLGRVSVMLPRAEADPPTGSSAPLPAASDNSEATFTHQSQWLNAAFGRLTRSSANPREEERS